MSTLRGEELAARVATLPPEKRRLFELRLRQAGLEGPRGEEEAAAIPRRQGSGPWPLSFGQQRLWFIDHLNPGLIAYNIPFAGRLRGPLDAGLLIKALRAVVGRHEVLRSRFPHVDGQPVQVVDPEPPLTVPRIDLSGLGEAARDRQAAELVRAEPRRPFDLARGPVVRFSLLRRASDDHELLVTMPHLVTDAWSMAILFRELPALYDAFAAGRPSPLPELPIQVADHAQWQRGHFTEAAMAKEIRFWKGQLEGAPQALELPLDRARPPVQTYRGKRQPVALSADLVRRINALGERNAATLFMTLTALYGLVLGRHCGQEEVLIGSPVVTRQQPETHPLIGFFINTAVLRVSLGGNPSFLELLARVREMTLQSLAHQDLPFERLVEALGVPRDLSRPPLAQAQLVLQNVHIPEPDFAGLKLVASQQTDILISRFDLTLALWEPDDQVRQGLNGGFEYATDLFDATTIRRLSHHFLALVDAVLADPSRPLDRLPMLEPGERHQLVAEHNEAGDDPALCGLPGLAATASVVERVARQAELRPEAIAVVDGESGAQISYGELWRRAGEVAAEIALSTAEAADGERRVAVEMARSPGLVLVLLGIWRAGAAYVPLDPQDPPRRRQRLLARVRPRVRIAAADGTAADTMAADTMAADGARPEGEPELPTLRVEAASGRVTGAAGRPAGDPMPIPPLRPQPHPHHLAAVLFTSGTTGEPRGVAVPHRGMTRLVAGRMPYHLGPGETLLHFSLPVFDGSTLEIWGALAHGGRLVVYGEAHPSLEALAGVLARQRVTTLWLTSGLFQVLAAERPGALAGARQLLTGGDVVPPGPAVELLAEHPGLTLINGYGPTEGTTATACYRVPGDHPADRPLPLGRPLAGSRVLLADGRDRLAPLGVAGELLIGGVGLARGYFDQPAATAVAFVPDFLSGEPGERLYRSGDLARQRPDGRLDFLGRRDHQVKVRGFRVEPGEAEAALAAHPEVAAAAVVPRRDLPGGTGLVAYVVAPALAAADREGSQAPPAALLRAWLRERLPEPLVPGALVFLPSLPLTANGKVDRRALPDPRLGSAPGGANEPAQGGDAPAPAVTEKEERLTRVWERVLGRGGIRRSDSFFDLGGDSILAIQLVARAAEAGFHFEPAHLFAHPTVEQLAAVAQDAPRVDAEQGEVTGTFPLTPIQRWFFALDLPCPSHWNMALALEVQDRLEGAALERAVGELVCHHDLLRARFPDAGASRRGRIEAAGGAVPFSWVDLSAVPAEGREAALAAAAARIQGSLDLASGPLFRVALCDLGPDLPQRLLLAAHHLVVDAVSWGILLADLRRLYQRHAAAREAADLPPKTTSFPAWAKVLAAFARTAEARQALDFWKEMASRGVPAGLPADIAGHSDREADAFTVTTLLPAGETGELLSTLPERLKVRTEEALVAAAARTLGAWAGREELWMDLEGHGREAALFAGVSLARTVGWFTAVCPLLIPTGAGGDPISALKGTKEILRRLPAGGLLFGALRYLGDGEAARSLSRLPRPEVCFNYLGRVDPPAEEPWRLLPDAAGPLRDPAGERTHRLSLDAYVLDGRLHLAWTASRSWFREGTLAELGRSLREDLRALLQQAREPAGAVLTPADFPQADLDQAGLDRLLSRLQPRAGEGGR